MVTQEGKELTLMHTHASDMPRMVLSKSVPASAYFLHLPVRLFESTDEDTKAHEVRRPPERPLASEGQSRRRRPGPHNGEAPSLFSSFFLLYPDTRQSIETVKLYENVGLDIWYLFPFHLFNPNKWKVIKNENIMVKA